MASSQSPISSPRLPSPPPIAEDQIGPTSPGAPLFEDAGKLPHVNSIDSGAARRIRPGSKAEEMAEGPALVEVYEIDSAFQLTEHLKALHYAHTHPPNNNTVHPITAESARILTTPPPNTSRDIWLYELGRFLIMKTNAIIVALFADNPPCSSHTCPEMRASEWQYLCAVHDPPKSCAAIDYCCHTLDWAASAVASPKTFPSRLGLGSGSGNAGFGGDKVLQTQMKEIKNIFRRVYRIYAHAWFQHREMFWRTEGKTGLYIFFKTVCDEYGIIEPENYTIPTEAEGLENSEPDTPLAMIVAGKEATTQQPPAMLLQRPENSTPITPAAHDGGSAAGNGLFSTGDGTARHHRHTRSDLTSSVSNVIAEEVEEEDEAAAAPMETEAKEPIPQTATKEHAEESELGGGEEDVTIIEEEDEENEDEENEDGAGPHDLHHPPRILRSDTLRPIKGEEKEEGTDVVKIEESSVEADEPEGVDEAVKTEGGREEVAPAGVDREGVEEAEKKEADGEQDLSV